MVVTEETGIVLLNILTLKEVRLLTMDIGGLEQML